MTQVLQRNEKIQQILRAVKSIESMPEYKNVPVQQNLPQTMDREKCNKFSDYMTDVFVNVCNQPSIASGFQNWRGKSSTEKLKLASDIVKAFLGHLGQDIRGHRVPIYGRNGKQYKDMGTESDEKITAQLSQMPEISVMGFDKARPDDAMCVSSDKILRINTENKMYGDNPVEFLANLRHELVHVVDMFIPAISPLDADVRIDAIRNYVGPHENKEAYRGNPLEVNANWKRDEYRQRINAMLVVHETARNRAMNMKMLGAMGRMYQR